MCCVMIVEKCLFNQERDLKAVEPFGFVDLRDAFVHNCVPSNTPESETDYNGIQDPASILGTPSDVFDALRMAQDLESRASDKSESEKSD